MSKSNFDLNPAGDSLELEEADAVSTNPAFDAEEVGYLDPIDRAWAQENF